MNEVLIQKALFNKFDSHKYRFTNAFFFENESDFLSFMPNGYCYEVEIKISRSDFKADFKKIKHEIHEKNQSGNRFYIQKQGSSTERNPSWELCKQYPELIEAIERQHYSRMSGESRTIELSINTSSRIEFREVKNKHLPNKFFYAVPTGLISKEEVPDYAGLLYVDEKLKVTKIKDGKFIHKDKLDPIRVFNKIYYAYEGLLRQRFQKLT